MPNKMIRKLATEKGFTAYPLERGGHGVFCDATGYQIATFATAKDAVSAVTALRQATFVNAVTP